MLLRSKSDKSLLNNSELDFKYYMQFFSFLQAASTSMGVIGTVKGFGGPSKGAKGSSPL